MKNYDELAIIFKKKIDEDGNITFIPIKVVEGIYVEKENTFVDKEGTPYNHILENPNNYGFCYRDKIETYKKDHPMLTLSLIKLVILTQIKNEVYSYNIDEDTSAPVILFGKNSDGSDQKILFNEETAEIYQNKYPAFANLFIKTEEKNVSKKEELNISKAFNHITKTIIDQDEPIKQILTAIWKQSNGLINSRSKNILINGGSGTGKTQIFQILKKEIPLPCFITSAKEYAYLDNVKIPELIIYRLLQETNFDVEKASTGIIVIDNIEEVIHNKILAYNILELLEGKIYTFTINNTEITIDTSKIMIIGLNNSKELLKSKKNIIGFERTEEENNFSKYITTIDMNNLDLNSYIKILKLKDGIINANKKFLSTKGIKLTLKEGTIKSIAEIALTKPYGVRSLNEVVEKTLSSAIYEIAYNEDKHNELIISPETVKDNTKFALIERKELEEKNNVKN